MPKPNPKAPQTAAKNEAATKEKNQDTKKVKDQIKEQKKKIEQQIQEESDEEIEDVKPAKGKKAPAPKPAEKPKKAKKAVEEDEDDEDLADDDIYIPKKKLKTSNGAAVVTKGGNKKAQAAIEAEDDDEEEVEEEVKEQKPKPAKAKKTKAERFSKQGEDVDAPQRGILYIGHLPYGFMEDGIKDYFSQYGEILNIHLARSKKTARSMGFAFVEFKFKEVAKVAADSMNGYMFYGKKLVCRVLEDDEGMKVKTKKFRFIPYNKMFIQQKNREKDTSELKKEVKNLLKHEEKKRQKLKELGITYDFPGFKKTVEEAEAQK